MLKKINLFNFGQSPFWPRTLCPFWWYMFSITQFAGTFRGIYECILFIQNASQALCTLSALVLFVRSTNIYPHFPLYRKIIYSSDVTATIMGKTSTWIRKEWLIIKPQENKHISSLCILTGKSNGICCILVSNVTESYSSCALHIAIRMTKTLKSFMVFLQRSINAV